jgi:hypothetical protein
MNLIELDRALRQLRLGGMAAVIETRLRQAQAEPMTPIDLISCLLRRTHSSQPATAAAPSETSPVSRLTEVAR